MTILGTDWLEVPITYKVYFVRPKFQGISQNLAQNMVRLRSSICWILKFPLTIPSGYFSQPWKPWPGYGCQYLIKSLIPVISWFINPFFLLQRQAHQVPPGLPETSAATDHGGHRSEPARWAKAVRPLRRPTRFTQKGIKTIKKWCIYVIYVFFFTGESPTHHGFQY